MPIDDDVELDTEKEAPAKKKGGKLKLIILIVAGVLLLGGATAGVYFSGLIPAFSAHSGDEEDMASADSAEGKDAAKSKKGDKAKGKGKKNGKKKEPQVTLYLPLDPPFVVNFQDQGQLRYLQVTMEVMARDQETIDAVKLHLPVIRNNLTLMLSSQTVESLATREGKEKIRTETLAEIQKILKEQTGKPGVEAVYFTSFVMQ